MLLIQHNSLYSTLLVCFPGLERTHCNLCLMYLLPKLLRSEPVWRISSAEAREVTAKEFACYLLWWQCQAALECRKGRLKGFFSNSFRFVPTCTRTSYNHYSPSILHFQRLAWTFPGVVYCQCACSVNVSFALYDLYCVGSPWNLPKQERKKKNPHGLYFREKVFHHY